MIPSSSSALHRTTPDCYVLITVLCCKSSLEYKRKGAPVAIDYTMTVQDSILFVHAWGFDESLTEVEEYGKALVQACMANGVMRLLSDERDLEYRLGTFDTFEAAQFIAAYAPHIARAAVVPNAKHVVDAKFWETVAVNRGLSVRLFKDTDAARTWLLQS